MANQGSTKNKRTPRKRPIKKFTRMMRTKLMVLFCVLVVVFCALIGRLIYINYTDGEQYSKIVLAQQSYDSSTIPYQRGDIVDTNGTILATSVPVYNVVLDCFVMTEKEEYIAPTIQALAECFPQLDRSELEGYAKNDRNNRYIVLERRLPYEDTQKFIEMQNQRDENGKLVYPNIKGVWFEKEYKRYYPMKSLASATLGFTSAAGEGLIGLEKYYDETLIGTNGREYGYLNSDSVFNKTVIEPENGQTLVLSIDANIQSIVEEKIREFDEAFTNNFEERSGSENMAVLVMDPRNGAILAMADYPDFDCNDPKDLTALLSEEKIDSLSDDEKVDLLNQLWQNFCVSSTYEPGSVQKPLTEACGIETGTLSPDLTFECNGYEVIDRSTIHCVNRGGHGTETLEKALEDSCNDALMQMSYLIGVENFAYYQKLLGFGSKTGIDLPGEASAATLIFTRENMKKIDLATNAFGQNFNCTMVQMASAMSSIINGGTYYQPHVVRKIVDGNGNVVSTNESVEIKRTVSESTSDLIRGYMQQVVSEGTGKLAKVDGYSMGGKTGTAQKSGKEGKIKGKYLVSFLGFAPAEDPQVLVYCIIDEPNVEEQAHSSYAQNVVREIFEEVLPYMNIYPDEEFLGTNEGLDITGNNPSEEGEDQPEEGEDQPEEGEDQPEGGEDQPEEGEDQPEE